MIRSLTHAVTKMPADEAVKARVSAADDLLSARLSDAEIAFPVRLHMEFLPYNDIVWAYRRLEESHVSLGCCGGVLEDHRLMLITKEGKTVTVNFDRERFITRALELIHERAPHIAIGWTEENRARFAAK